MSSGSSQNVNLRTRGGVFADGSEIGHQQIQASYNQIKFPPPFMIPVTGEAVNLPNYPCAMVYIQNPLGNDPIVVGGTGDETASKDVRFTGDFRGTLIYEGDSFPFYVANTNLLTVVGTAQQYIGIHFYPDVSRTITPTNEIPPIPDTTGPVVSSTTPTNGATNQFRDLSEIIFDFNEDIDPETVTSSSFTISPSVTGVTRSLDPNDASNMVMTIPAGTLLIASTVYTVTATTAITDLLGNALASNHVITFTTGTGTSPADVTPPTITVKSPLPDTTGVAIGVAPMITFSERMLASSIVAGGSGSVKLKKVSTGAYLATEVSLSTDEKTVTITPNTSLEYSTVYQVEIMGGTSPSVEDLAGNPMDDPDQTWQFTTTAPTYTEKYNVAHNNSRWTLSNGSTRKKRAGLKVETSSSKMKGVTPKKIIVTMDREGSSGFTGDIDCEIWKADGSSLSIGNAILASAVTSSSAEFTFENPNQSYALQVGDRLVIEYDEGGDNNNYIKLKRDSTASYDGSNTIGTDWDNEDNAWQDNAGFDFAARIYQ